MEFRYEIGRDSIREASAEGQILVFSAPGEKERASILERFGLDPYDLDSALDADEVPRLEFEDDRAFMVWKTPKTAQVGEAIELGVGSVGLVLTHRQLVVIVNDGDFSFADREFRNARATLDVLLGILLRTVRHYVGHLRAIRQISGDLEKKITVSMENRYLLQMFALSESLVYYTDAIEGNGAALERLRNAGARLQLTEAQLELLDDIVLENRQASRQANIYSSVLSGLMDARGTIVNNNMNVLLKNLTLINTVFLPLNLIASIGGMSEWSMMTSRMDWRVSYSLFGLGMVLFGWGTWILVTRLIARGEKSAGRRQQSRMRGSVS